jgi:hypothetical protein
MPSNIDKSHGAPARSPGYETRDANARGVFYFLVYLGSGIVLSVLVCWGLFRYFSAEYAQSAPASPFAETRIVPSSPQLQVNPIEDLQKFREQQQSALEEYAWENRQNGMVRVPIERAMELLLQKGLPAAGNPTPEEKKPATQKGNPKQ